MDWPREAFIQISESQVGRAIRTARWKYLVVDPDADGWDDAASHHYVEQELYDLKADPDELHNLAGYETHRETAAILRERLIQRMVEAGEAAPSIDPAPVRAGNSQLTVTRDEAYL